MTARSATSTGGEATPGPTRRERYGATGTRATRVIGVLALLGLPLLLLLGLVTSPPDVTMGDSVRIMYVHVPSAWLAYLAFGVTALCSLLYLWKRTRASRSIASPAPRRRSASSSPGSRSSTGMLGAGRRGASTGPGTPA